MKIKTSDINKKKKKFVIFKVFKLFFVINFFLTFNKTQFFTVSFEN